MVRSIPVGLRFSEYLFQRHVRMIYDKRPIHMGCDFGNMPFNCNTHNTASHIDSRQNRTKKPTEVQESVKFERRTRPKSVCHKETDWDSDDFATRNAEVATQIRISKNDRVCRWLFLRKCQTLADSGRAKLYLVSCGPSEEFLEKDDLQEFRSYMSYVTLAMAALGPHFSKISPPRETEVWDAQILGGMGRGDMNTCFFFFINGRMVYLKEKQSINRSQTPSNF